MKIIMNEILWICGTCCRCRLRVTWGDKGRGGSNVCVLCAGGSEEAGELERV